MNNETQQQIAREAWLQLADASTPQEEEAVILAAITKATKEQQESLRKYVIAMDAIYNHNEAARSAVVQYFGIHHVKGALQDPR